MDDRSTRKKLFSRNPIDPDTGNEVKKSVFISAPYFPGLSESFKQLFRYTPVQVCFKGQKTIKSLLMHPKDKVDPFAQKGYNLPMVHAPTLTANLHTSGKPPGPSVKGQKNTVKKGQTRQSIIIVPPRPSTTQR